MGNNGSGKTMLLRLICDLIKPSKGEVTRNKNITKRKEKKQFEGMPAIAEVSCCKDFFIYITQELWYTFSSRCFAALCLCAAENGTK